MKNKHIIIGLGLVFIVAFLSSTLYLSLASFTSSDKVKNKAEVGYIDTSIIEKDENDETYDENKQVEEGDTITKKVYIKNNTKNDALIRTSITARWLNPANPTDVYQINDSDVKFIFDDDFSENWVQGSDGYYYYKHLLKGMEISKGLLKAVSISDNISSEYDGMELKVDIKTEAVEPTKISEKYLFRDMWKSLKDNKIIEILKNTVDKLY